MDCFWRTNKIIRLPILDLQKLDPIGSRELDPELIALLQECRAKINWAREVTECRQEYKAAKYKLRPQAESLLKGICYICEGTKQCSRYARQAAINLYREAERVFEDEGHEYGRGIALMALGMTHQSNREYEEARKLYEQSCQAFESLDQEYKLWHGVCKESPYRRFCQQLSIMIQQTESENARRLPVVCLVGEVMAGIPTYLPGERYQDPVDAVILDGTQYEFLNWKDRQKTPLELNSEYMYFVVTTKGDSMDGPDVKILNGDQLLVRKCEVVADRDIAVLEYDDYKAIVKRFRSEDDHHWLESANPDYKTLEFTETTKIRGRVEAILRKAAG